MDRPDKIYLDEQIQQHGFKIGHTLEGLRYMVDHHTKVLAIATAKQMDDKTRQHLEERVAQYKQHIEWYENQPRVATKPSDEQPAK